MIPFLRGARVMLAAGEGVPTPRADEDAWLLADPEPARWLREAHLIVVDEAGARCGVASLAPIEWERHAARVAIFAVPGAPVAQALELVARYACDELNLEQLWADAASIAAARVLAAAGWRDDGGRRWVWTRPTRRAST